MQWKSFFSLLKLDANISLLYVICVSQPLNFGRFVYKISIYLRTMSQIRRKYMNVGDINDALKTNKLYYTQDLWGRGWVPRHGLKWESW